MDQIQSDLTQPALARAVKANLYAFFDHLRRSPDAAVADFPHGFRWRTPIAHPWFNGVLTTQPPAAQSAQFVSETLAYFQSSGVSAFSWWLAPDLPVEPWSALLLGNGFQFDERTPGMALDLTQLAPPAVEQLVIRPVENLTVLREWTDVFVQGYGIPSAMTQPFYALLAGVGLDLPFRHYLGFWDGLPVATATLFLGAGVAGIYNVATLPAARGKGIGGALTAVPLLAARQSGYRIGILQSSEMGFSVYQRLGFQVCCQMEHFFWHA